MNGRSSAPSSRPDGALVEMRRPSVVGMSTAQLEKLAERLGQPAFRGRQLADWVYRKRVTDLSLMTNLPGPFREALAQRCEVRLPDVVRATEAPDLTTKLLLGLRDGAKVETVLLPYADRTSVCVSSQVGCAAGCAFCATATMGFLRNLDAGEMVAQVLAAANALDAAAWRDELAEGGRRVSHVVFMGMGEPLWNLAPVVEAVHLLNEELGIAMRSITVSTVGIPDAMRELAALNLQLTLAVSLHAGTEETRRMLVPTTGKYPLDDVLSAARQYFDATGRRVTFEYVVLGGVNDTPDEAFALAERLRGTPAHVNLIPWNPAESAQSYAQPRKSALAGFRTVLEEAGIAVTQRMERGRGIAAACGQLAVKETVLP